MIAAILLLTPSITDPEQSELMSCNQLSLSSLEKLGGRSASLSCLGSPEQHHHHPLLPLSPPPLLCLSHTLLLLLSLPLLEPPPHQISTTPHRHSLNLDHVRLNCRTLRNPLSQTKHRSIRRRPNPSFIPLHSRPTSFFSDPSRLSIERS